jgi:hypothetical protein
MGRLGVRTTTDIKTPENPQFIILASSDGYFIERYLFYYSDPWKLDLIQKRILESGVSVLS